MRLYPDPIVVAVGDGCGSGAALCWAAHQAALEHRPLRLVYASLASDTCPTEMLAELGGPLGGQHRGEEDPASVLADAAETVYAFEPHVVISTSHTPRTPVRSLLEQARAAAMVVLANHGASVLADLIGGTVCGRVAAKAPCPVIAISGRPAWPDMPIVVGIDSIDTAGDIAAFAVALAFHRGVRVLVHHVHRQSVAYSAHAIDDLIAAHAARYPQVPLEISCSSGNPVTELADVAAEAQLLVVGTRGYSAATGFLAGSLSHALLRKAPCPLAVIPKNSHPLSRR
jgi:nucleotide-binding universal stress UspA family protein